MPLSRLVQKIKSEIAFYKDLAKDTEGASGIEYAIVAAMVAVVIATFSSAIGTSIRTLFTSIQNAL